MRLRGLLLIMLGCVLSILVYSPRSAYAATWPDTVLPLEGAGYSIIDYGAPVVGNFGIICGAGVFSVDGSLMAGPITVVQNVAHFQNNSDYFYQRSISDGVITTWPYRFDLTDCTDYFFSVRAYDGQSWYDVTVDYLSSFSASPCDVYVVAEPEFVACNHSFGLPSYSIELFGSPRLDDRIIEFSLCYAYMDTDPLRLDNNGDLFAVPANRCFGYRWYVNDGSLGLLPFGVAPSSEYSSPYTTLWYVDQVGVSSQQWAWVCGAAGVDCGGTLSYDDGSELGLKSLNPVIESTFPITSTGTLPALSLPGMGVSVAQDNILSGLRYVYDTVAGYMTFDLTALQMLGQWLYVAGIMMSTISPLLPGVFVPFATVAFGFVVFMAVWGVYRLVRTALI